MVVYKNIYEIRVGDNCEYEDEEFYVYKTELRLHKGELIVGIRNNNKFIEDINAYKIKILEDCDNAFDHLK